MVTIKRLLIVGQHGVCNDPAYKYVTEVLHRRYGNALTFCFDWEVVDIINQFKVAGFDVVEDTGFVEYISEPEDYGTAGNIVYAYGTFGNIKLVVKGGYDGDSILVKYAEYPRKHAFVIYKKTKGQFEGEITKYGNGTLTAYKIRNPENVI